ncbi:acyl-CoA reductase [Ferruginibacter yonginensis]|uniref:Acyl-CoA reductase n=1 Tax=Ferruginibacter yonginensis TaxID=1310416 RepID=A0ABV8QQQ0_9BACT
MILQERIEILEKLGQYLQKNTPEWQQAKQLAYQKNGWFTEAFIDAATQNIITHFLSKTALQQWVTKYHLDDNIIPKNVGIVMAGNIPMVGFHDMLAVFVSGHYQTIKLSSKDDVLLKHVVQFLITQNNEVQHYISIADMLKGCDAYIATGGNNAAATFETYFGKYPHIIRKNRTSVAILNGSETAAELALLADDIHYYFGLGCRNVTKLYVPNNYDFVPVLQSFKKYQYFADHHKYKNNYDYQLSIVLLNNVYYMTNEATMLIENKQLFSPISQLHYEFYTNVADVVATLKNNDDVQCIVGKGFEPFGAAQQPSILTYADGVDTMQFLLTL